MSALAINGKNMKGKRVKLIAQRWWRRLSFSIMNFCNNCPKISKNLGYYLSLWLFLIVGLYGFIAGGHTIYLIDKISKHFGITVQQLEISGMNYVTEDMLLATLGPRSSQSLLDFDVWEAQRRLNNLSWIESAEVTKSYPNKIIIKIVERIPFAILKNGEDLQLIDKNSVVLTKLNRNNLPALPLVISAGGEKNLPLLIETLQRYPKILNRVAAFIWVGGRRWDLLLRNNIKVKLPEFEWKDKISQLVEFDEKYQILSKDIEIVDLRIENRMALKVSEDTIKANNARVQALLNKAEDLSRMIVR